MGITPLDGDPMGHARLLRQRPRLGDAQRVQIVPDGAASVPARRGHHDTPVPATQVVEHVVGRHAGQLEHARHHIVRRDDELDEDDGGGTCGGTRGGGLGRGGIVDAAVGGIASLAAG